MMMGEIKTLAGWGEFCEETGKSSWGNYVSPGDLVDEEVYDYFLNVLPPRSFSAGYLQVGEPFSHRANPKTGICQATYMTFVSANNGLYRYCGNCFAGETENIK